MYLSLHCHHQNDSCIKMDSNESHFNVSLIVRDKSHKTKSQDSVHKPQLLKRKESRSGIEQRSFRLPAYRLTARPNRLSAALIEKPGRVIIGQTRGQKQRCMSRSSQNCAPALERNSRNVIYTETLH